MATAADTKKANRNAQSLASRAVMLFCRLMALVALVGVASRVNETLHILSDPERGFAPSLLEGQTAAEAVGCAVVVLPLGYICYFLNWGRRFRLAVGSLIVTAAPVLLHLAYSLQPRLPGGLVNMEIVIGAGVLLFFQVVLTLGVALRVGSIRARRHGQGV